MIRQAWGWLIAFYYLMDCSVSFWWANLYTYRDSDVGFSEVSVFLKKKIWWYACCRKFLFIIGHKFVSSHSALLWDLWTEIFPVSGIRFQRTWAFRFPD